MAVELDNLKSIRQNLGKSQSEMAELLGISVRAIQSYEQGWRKPPPSVQKLAAFFLFLRWQKDNPRQLSCWKIQGLFPPEPRRLPRRFSTGRTAPAG